MLRCSNDLFMGNRPGPVNDFCALHNGFFVRCTMTRRRSRFSRVAAAPGAPCCRTALYDTVVRRLVAPRPGLEPRPEPGALSLKRYDNHPKGWLSGRFYDAVRAARRVRSRRRPVSGESVTMT